MKKQLVMGMLTVVVTMSFASHGLAAAPVMAKRTVIETLKDYTKETREALFGKGGTAKGLDSKAFESAKSKLVEEVQVGGKVNALRTSLTGEKAAARMDALTTVVAAKRMADNISKVDPVEGKSISDSANAVAKFIANSNLTGTVGKQKMGTEILEAIEVKEVSEALLKVEELPTSIITDFKVAERDGYTKVLEKHDLLVESGMASEAAFVKSIMEVKGISKEKALELIKKLKECVA